MCLASHTQPADDWRLSNALNCMFRCSAVTVALGSPKRSTCIGARGGSIINESIFTFSLPTTEVGAYECCDGAEPSGLARLSERERPVTTPSWMARNSSPEALACAACGMGAVDLPWRRCGNRHSTYLAIRLITY